MNKAYKKITWMIVLFAAIVVFCGLAYRNTVHFEQTVVAQTQQHLLTIARIQAQRIEENINNVLEELERLAQKSRLKHLVNTDGLLSDQSGQDDYASEEYSFKCLKRHVNALYRLDRNGTVQHRIPAGKDDKRTGQDYSQKPGVKFVLENHRSYISKIFSTFSGQKAISVCVPVVQKDSLIGVLRALIYLDTLHDVVRPIKIGQKGYAWIIDDSGIMIAHPKPEHIGKDIIAVRKEAFPGFDWSRLEHIVARMTNSEQGVGSYSSAWWQDQDLELVEKLTAFAPIRIGNALWSVGVSMGYDEISGPIKSHTRNILALAGILTLMFVAIAVGFYRMHEEKAMLQMQASSARQLESINKQLQSEIAERKGAEQALAEQVCDLERFNRVAVGRELRMIELKRQINDLTQQAGKQGPYDLSFAQNLAGSDQGTGGSDYDA